MCKACAKCWVVVVNVTNRTLQCWLGCYRPATLSAASEVKTRNSRRLVNPWWHIPYDSACISCANKSSGRQREREENQLRIDTTQINCSGFFFLPTVNQILDFPLDFLLFGCQSRSRCLPRGSPWTVFVKRRAHQGRRAKRGVHNRLGADNH